VEEGVVDGHEFGYSCEVYDFARQSQWLDNDSPGWGASHADAEGRVIKGNTFDFCSLHGMALLEAGYGFISVSEAAFCKGEADKGVYKVVDIIFGEERTKKGVSGSRFDVLDLGMRQKLEACMLAGKSILISGAYIGTDMVERRDSVAMVFAGEKLGFKWRSDHADKGGLLKGVGDFGTGSWHYNSGQDERVYRVESPDAIEPAQKDATVILRYEETGKSAGVFYDGLTYRVIVLGFPLESMVNEDEMVDLMGRMVKRLSGK